MSKRMFRRLALLAFVACSSMFASACYMEADYPVYEDGYEPQFYNGYVVYYADDGRPYYYADDVGYWVPPTAPVYVGLVNHWRMYRVQYHAWYVHRGYGYRHYHGYHYAAATTVGITAASTVAVITGITEELTVSWQYARIMLAGRCALSRDT